MTRNTQKEPTSPRELQRLSSEQKAEAKRVAVGLLEKALSSHILSSHDSNNFVSAVCKALSVDEAALNKGKKKRIHSTTETSANAPVSHKKKGRSNSFDDHDEVCEVCEKGGDLLCCDTCTLVFHLKCFRPKLSGIPKGSWSCPHCIIDDLADGDVRAAKSSIRVMNRLARGIDSDDESSFTGAIGPAEVPDPMRTSSIGEFLVVRKGKKFVLKQTQRKQLVDIGKYLTLEDALNYIKEGEFNAEKEATEKAAAAAAAASKKNTSKGTLSSNSSSNSLSSRRRSTPSLSEHTPRDDRSATEKEGDVNGEEDGEESSRGYDELWCSHCMDDKGVTVCVFCGCKVCFGKFDSSLLILCDHCERETHTYCLDPPLSAVPEQDPWYCQSCVIDGLPDQERSVDNDSQNADQMSLALGASGSDGDFGLGFDADLLPGTSSATKKRTWSQGSAGSGGDMMGEWDRGLKKIRAWSESDGTSRPRGKYQTKALLAAAASNDLSTGKHRGRGRPPGSGKRPPQSTTLTTTADLQESSTALEGFFPFKDKLGSWSNSNSGDVTNKNRRSKSLGWDENEGEEDFGFEGLDCGSFDLYDEHGRGLADDLSQDGADNPTKEEKKDIQEADTEIAAGDQHEGGDEGEAEIKDEAMEEVVEEVEEEVFELGAVGIRSALQVIARASAVSGKVEGGPWSEEELDLLEQVRAWAPVCDLQKAFSALLEQKEILVKKIQAQEPYFNCQEMERVIAAQLAETRRAEQALLGGSGAFLPGVDSAVVASTAAAAVIAPAPLGIAAAAVVPKPKRVSKPKQPAAAKAASDKPAVKKAAVVSNTSTVAQTTNVAATAPAPVGVTASTLAPQVPMGNTYSSVPSTAPIPGPGQGQGPVSGPGGYYPLFKNQNAPPTASYSSVPGSFPPLQAPSVGLAPAAVATTEAPMTNILPPSL